MTCVETLKKGETFPENPLELPCFIGSLSALRGGENFVLVKLLIPNNGIPAWVDKRDLTIVRQSATDEGIKGFLRSSIVSEDEKDYTVEIMDRDHTRRVEVPKEWLTKEMARFRIDKTE